MFARLLLRFGRKHPPLPSSAGTKSCGVWWPSIAWLGGRVPSVHGQTHYGARPGRKSETGSRGLPALFQSVKDARHPYAQCHGQFVPNSISAFQVEALYLPN
jgi:hypothetical protein